MSARRELAERAKALVHDYRTAPEAFRQYADFPDGLLEALAIALLNAEEELRIREEFQIPVIPKGAAEKMARLEMENAVLKEALELIDIGMLGLPASVEGETG